MKEVIVGDVDVVSSPIDSGVSGDGHMLLDMVGIRATGPAPEQKPKNV